VGGHNDNEHAAWSAHFDEGSLAAETASALHLLGDLGGAERHASMVLQLRRGDRVRALAFGRLTLALILIDAGRTEEAAALGREVSAVTPTLASARVRVRLGELAMAVRSCPRAPETTAFLADMARLDAGDTPELITAWPV